ncbi:hypothetical protein [Bacillus massilinigeriensis]|uniref:hypothetical protein n=1 Tax=Bacillus mediterraneensis TaxID=1805474 RepID=UPI0008F91A81|nr:hypothetical protein [Bacillus mediterraneensis]
MNNPVLIFLAAILAGFALLNLPDIALLANLVTFFQIAAAIAIILFSFVLFYIALRTLFSGCWK